MLACYRLLGNTRFFLGGVIEHFSGVYFHVIVSRYYIHSRLLETHILFTYWTPSSRSCFFGITHTRWKTWRVLDCISIFRPGVFMIVLCYCPKFQPRPISLPLVLKNDVLTHLPWSSLSLCLFGALTPCVFCHKQCPDQKVLTHSSGSHFVLTLLYRRFHPPYPTL